MTKKTKTKTVLIVANCTWYLYNFRKEFLFKLSDQGYYLILVSPLDKYYYKLKNYFDSDENLFLKRGSENPIFEIITLLNLLFIYLKYKPDLVHNFTIKPCLYGGMISRFLRVKNTINHITGLGPSFYSDRIKTNFINKILRPLYKYAFNSDHNIMNVFHNDSDRNTFISKNITSIQNSKVIPGSGVDINNFKKEKIKKSKNSIKKVLFPARIIKEKGIVELIYACEELWNENYEFVLNIAGEIDTQNKSHINRKAFEYLIKNKNIFFLGKCNNMKEIYKNMDIVVLPSWREGLSKSLLEAASMEMPIITTNVPGCRDIIKNKFSGIVVNVKSKEKLKYALKLILNDEKLASKLGQNAREIISEKYTVQNINEQIYKIYKNFLKV